MRSLFLKIFLWFWGAMILIGVALFLVVTTTQPDPLPGPWRESTGNLLAAYAMTAASAWEQGGRSRLAAYLDKQERLTDSQYLFFDEQGNELSGHRLRPPAAPAGASPRNREVRPLRWRRPPPGGMPDGRLDQRPDGRPDDRSDGRPDERPLGGLPFLRPGPPPEPPEFAYDDWERLRQEALGKDKAVFALRGPMVMAAQRVQAAGGRRYILQALLPRPRFGRPAAEPISQVSGVLVVLAMSGLVCYGLVRYLTSPIVSLRLATRRLAAGDLTARTGASSRARRDEVADLGRDFDTMAERIETLVTSQQRLLGDISHELRSPLARLTVGLALARRHVADGSNPEQIEAAFDRIKRETGRLNFLIEQLLQLTRLESGASNSGKTQVELSQLVREIVDDTNFEIRGGAAQADRGVVLVSKCICYINGSAELLSSAVENVVRNAVRYTHAGTNVEVSLDCVPGPEDSLEAVIRVRDHGDGVPPAALSELFRPFYRVADARDRESGGIGLGLAITERAIHSHGGRATARNATDGGLIIELRLPVTTHRKTDSAVSPVEQVASKV